MRAMSLARCAIGRHSSRKITLVGNKTALQKIKRINSSAQVKLIELDDRLGESTFRQQVLKAFEQVSFSKLIVDTFPRGIVGELQPVLDTSGITKIFVHRDIEPEYITRKTVLQSVEKFDLVLVPGEDAPLANMQTSRKTHPWVLLDSVDLCSRTEARDILKCPDESRPLCLVSLSGKPAEKEMFSQIACELMDRLKDRCAIAICGDVPPTYQSRLQSHRIDYWPVMKLLTGVDLLVGAGGYNTFYEAKLSQTELHSLPQKRLYDRQWKRVGDVRSYGSAAELIFGLEKRLKLPLGKIMNTDSISYSNGVHRAVDAIEELN